VFGIGSAVALMTAAVLAAGPWLGRRGDLQVRVATPPSRPIAAPDRPIAAEAGVFRTRPGNLAAAPGVRRRPDAHPRTLARQRAQRAYPGAPPSIPHGLTAREMRDQNCKTCHERGGFVPRFSAYAPVTPHPEMVSCLQCHAPKDALVGVDLPETSTLRCTQCHAMDRVQPLFVEMDWPQPRWPRTGLRALPGSPPAIPHRLQFRENCVACHTGPSAIAEIRTTHAERANCRQCHVESAAESSDGADVFTRPLDPDTGPAGRTP
jgi:cytochrome c-type protein NapB